jgi:hypothetical protein
LGYFKKAGRTEVITFFKHAPNFYCGNESATRRSGGRILPGDYTGGEAVMLRPIRFQCVGVWILT